MVRKRGDRWWVRVWDADQGKQVVLGTFDTKREALDVERAFKSKPVPAHAITVTELRDRWLKEWSKSKGWRESTLIHNRERTTRYAKEQGDRRVCDVTVSDALRYSIDHPGDVPALRAMFAFGRRIEATFHNPFSKLGIGRKRGQKIGAGRGALTEEELHVLSGLAGTLHGEWHRAFILFAGLTGMRQGEIFGLRFGDLSRDAIRVERAVNAKTGLLDLPKNGLARTIVYPAVARGVVRDVPRDPHQEWVFVNPRDRARWSAQAYGYYWRQLRMAFHATLDPSHWLSIRLGEHSRPLVFHELRHTCATMLLERGVLHADVAVQLGHTDGGKLVMGTYGHPSEDLARERLRMAYASVAPGPAMGERDEDVA